MLTSAKRETGQANTINATTDNIQTFRHEVLINTGPGEACSDLDSLLILAENDFIETVMEIWTPRVDEKPGFPVLPEHLIANGVRE